MKTNWTKLGIFPTDGLEYWHVIESDNVFADYSGNNRHITASSNPPAVVTEQIGRHPAIYFDGATHEPLAITPPNLLLKHFFLVAKYDGATFAGYEGLLSDVEDLPVLIGGGAGTTKFFNLAYGLTDYRKNDVSYAESDMQAPMNAWALIEIQIAAGLPFAGFQIGRDRDQTARRWKGRFAGGAAFSRILTSVERRRALLYYNLRFGRYFDGASALQLEFPVPELTGLDYARFYELPPDWSEITVEHRYQDAGKSFNETSEDPPRRWEVGFQGLSFNEARLFDEFHERARLVETFSFTDKYGETHTVQIEEYKRSHPAHRSWTIEASFRLVKYP